MKLTRNLKSERLKFFELPINQSSTRITFHIPCVWGIDLFFTPPWNEMISKIFHNDLCESDFETILLFFDFVQLFSICDAIDRDRGNLNSYLYYYLNWKLFIISLETVIILFFILFQTTSIKKLCWVIPY